MNNRKLLCLAGMLVTLFFVGLPIRSVTASEPNPTRLKPAVIHADNPLLASSDNTLHLVQSGRVVTVTAGRTTTRLSLSAYDGTVRLPLATGTISLRLPTPGQVDLYARYDEAHNRLTLEPGGDLDLAAVDIKSDLIIDSPGLVTVSGPVAVYGFTITSRALALTPAAEVTASGSAALRTTATLSLHGSRLAIDGDMALHSGRALTLRDSVTRPLVVSAGGDLYLQAGQTIDIVALNHPASALISGGAMRLQSPNPVRGDVHYISGGPFTIEQPDGRPGHLLSPYDPIVFANGDVTIGNYTGASLHVLAGGSVTLGSVTITGPDTGPNAINPGNTTPFNGVDTIAALANVPLSNGIVVPVNGASTPTLDVRAGIDWSTFNGGAPGNQTIPATLTPTFSPATGADITVTGNISMTNQTANVLLTNQYRPNALNGSITTAAINVGATQPQIDGGLIGIDSRGDITVGTLNAAADVAGQQVTAGNGGSIGLLAPNGAIVSSGNLSTFARTPGNSSGSAGNGGAIVAVAANGITLNNGTGAVNSFASSNSDGSAGNGGPVILTTINGDIRTGVINSFSFAIFNGSSVGDAGDIFLQADGGSIIVGDNFFASINAASIGFSPGNGGSVTLVANADITATGDIRTLVSGPDGDAGAINLFSATGDITTADLLAQASSNGVPGNGGNVSVEAVTGAVTTGDVLAFSNAFFINNDARDAGDIRLTALGDITTGNLENYSEARGAQGDAGQAGTITLESQGGSITGSGNMLAFSRSALNNGQSATAQDGGDIIVQASGNISISGRIDALSESAIFGGGVVTATAQNGGTIALTATTGSIVTGGNLNSYASADLDAGSGGPVSLLAATGIRLNSGSGIINSFARSEEGGVVNGGDVTLNTAAGDILLGAIDSRAVNTFADSPTGNGGDISLVTQNGSVILNGGFFAALQSSASGSDLIGNSGDITVLATQGISIDGPVTTQAFGDDGNG
ncbi:MAG: hypothetical protein KDJ65_27510, partial [Anaerolineae bacterium]|nr:hypothetical protein [Anaerolineae bacterium]